LDINRITLCGTDEVVLRVKENKSVYQGPVQKYNQKLVYILPLFIQSLLICEYYYDLEMGVLMEQNYSSEIKDYQQTECSNQEIDSEENNSLESLQQIDDNNTRPEEIEDEETDEDEEGIPTFNDDDEDTDQQEENEKSNSSFSSRSSSDVDDDNKDDETLNQQTRNLRVRKSKEIYDLTSGNSKFMQDLSTLSKTRNRKPVNKSLPPSSTKKSDSKKSGARKTTKSKIGRTTKTKDRSTTKKGSSNPSPADKGN
jgi:hypothetical protein